MERKLSSTRSEKLPQAGILAQELLEKRLNAHGYSQNPAVPGLWMHISHPISFTLVVNDFGIKYVGEEHAKHLLDVLREHYEISINWSGSKFIGLTLDWDYVGRMVHPPIHAWIRGEAATPLQP